MQPQEPHGLLSMGVGGVMPSSLMPSAKCLLPSLLTRPPIGEEDEKVSGSYGAAFVKVG